MKKILSIHWGFSLGGVAKYAAMIENVNRYAPVQIESLCILSPRWQIDTKTLQKLNHAKLEVRGRTDLSWMDRIVPEIEKRKPDLILTHGYNGHYVVMVAALKMGRQLPHICSYHGLYHPTTLLRGGAGPIFNRIALHVLKYRAIGIVSVAQYCKQYLVSKGVDPKKIVVIHNGLHDIELDSQSLRAKLRREWGFTEENVVIGLASRLDPVKGVKYFINAMPKVLKSNPLTRAVILGQGTVASKLQKLVSKLGLQKQILFAGFRTDVPECMCAFDIFAIPSLAEYHAIGLLEALRAGLPSVATSVGGNPESICNGVEGFLVPPAKVEPLAEALGKLVSNPNLRQQMGKAARKRFLEEFTVHKMVSSTANWLYEMAVKVERLNLKV